MTPEYAAGYWTTSEPSFPAAATTTTPRAIALATEVASTALLPGPPSDMLITLAPCPTAQSMPSATSASYPSPFASSTLTGMALTFQPTPATPAPLFAAAAMMPSV